MQIAEAALTGAIIFAVSVMAQSLWTVAATEQPSKRIKQWTYWLEPMDSMPADVREAEAACDLVARIRVVGRGHTKDDPVPTTRYELEVLEIFASKPAVSAARIIPFAALGGTVDRGDYLYQMDVPGFPLEPDTEYIAFLTWHEGQQAYVLLYGEDSLWRIDGGRIKSRGRSALTAVNQNRSAADVATELRKNGVQR